MCNFFSHTCCTIFLPLVVSIIAVKPKATSLNMASVCSLRAVVCVCEREMVRVMGRVLRALGVEMLAPIRADSAHASLPVDFLLYLSLAHACLLLRTSVAHG